MPICTDGKVRSLYSRLVVGWMVADRESSGLAARLLRETAARQGIAPGQLTVHADRGSSMRSRPVALLLSGLGIAKTYSRPHVSDDNPYSESQFKTLEYSPWFPGRFGSLQDARGFCRRFFDWCNNGHRHGGVAMMTPASVHYGLAAEVAAGRAAVLGAAHAAHPERFVRGAPRPPEVPAAAWINKPKAGGAADAPEKSLICF